MPRRYVCCARCAAARAFKGSGPTQAWNSLAEAILERHADQDFSFTDAVSFAVMQERGIEEAFTFDSHFATLGFRMIPG